MCQVVDSVIFDSITAKYRHKRLENPKKCNVIEVQTFSSAGHEHKLRLNLEYFLCLQQRTRNCSWFIIETKTHVRDQLPQSEQAAASSF
jgi:hypothetical protein